VLNTWMESLNGSYPFQPFVLGGSGCRSSGAYSVKLFWLEPTRVEPHMLLHSKGILLAFVANVRPEAVF
jgi:hypothetical protein